MSVRLASHTHICTIHSVSFCSARVSGSVRFQHLVRVHENCRDGITSYDTCMCARTNEWTSVNYKQANGTMANAFFLLFSIPNYSACVCFSVVQHGAWHVGQTMKKLESSPGNTLQLMHFIVNKNNVDEEQTANDCAMNTRPRTLGLSRPITIASIVLWVSSDRWMHETQNERNAQITVNTHSTSPTEFCSTSWCLNKLLVIVLQHSVFVCARWK